MKGSRRHEHRPPWTERGFRGRPSRRRAGGDGEPGAVQGGDGSGWDAYLRYSKGFAALMKAIGATILWAGKVEGAAFGDVGDRPWDFVVLVRYPSRQAFLEVLTSADYAKANVHRENGVEDHMILSASETYSKFPPPEALKPAT